MSWRTLQLLAFTLVCLLTPSLGNAIEFTFQWTGTLDGGVNFPVGVSLGDPLTMSFVVNNGSPTSHSQTWGADDVIYVTMEVNGGAYDIVYLVDSVFIGDGNFSTDAQSAITSVPSHWVMQDRFLDYHSTFQTDTGPGSPAYVQWIASPPHCYARYRVQLIRSRGRPTPFRYPLDFT